MRVLSGLELVAAYMQLPGRYLPGRIIGTYSYVQGIRQPMLS